MNDRDYIDLTTVRHWLSPQERLSAIDEWRRMQRSETIEVGVMIALGVAVAVGLAWVLTWLTTGML